MPCMWMVRAERNGQLYEDFKEKEAVAVGWFEVGPLDELTTREAIFEKVAREWPDEGLQWQRVATSVLHRFRNEVDEGDRVVTYEPSRRVYLLGTIAGPYRWDPLITNEHPHLRPVRWDGEVSRDLLSVATKNSLGAILTLFLVPDHAAADLERALASQEPAIEEALETPAEAEVEESALIEDVQSRATEFIKDKISRLDWREMQQLVAGVLRAMGYKTRVSPDGPDRGKDIIASPDGFGFETPRIIVEVKHRTAAMGSQEIRSFLGGRHQSDKGLYVSTGGFTKEARYEADRASIPIHLMNIDDLVEAVVENYDALDSETRQLLPLKRIYWPM